MKGWNFGRLFILYYFMTHLYVNIYGKRVGNLSLWGFRDKMSAHGFEESRSVSSTPRFWCLSPVLVPFAWKMELILSMGCGGAELCARDLCLPKLHTRIL